ncbi:MAG: serine/threonine-protein kinase [Terriglobales bacterium]|jgi:serine/threonine protein kinase
MSGRTFSHYRVLETIGTGGMGVVYRAYDERLGREVAVKVLDARKLADEVARKRFQKEARMLSRVNHPNIATIHDFGTHAGVDFLVMEYVPGLTLDIKLAQGALAESEVLQLGMQLALGLEAAHRVGVAHCDLKPGNLRVTPDYRLKILDFGLAKLFSINPDEPTPSLTDARGAGTLPYMAPEQLGGRATDAWTDIWAAGVLLYEMSTGCKPFNGEGVTGLAADILHRSPTPPRSVRPEISAEFENVILNCLEKQPHNRYRSAQELRIDLKEVMRSKRARRSIGNTIERAAGIKRTNRQKRFSISTLRAKWRSLGNDKWLALGLAVALSLLLWIFPQLWKSVWDWPNLVQSEKLTSVQVEPTISPDRPQEIAFDIANNGSTSIKNVVVGIHEQGAAGGPTNSVFYAHTFPVLYAHSVVARIAFYSLAGFESRDFWVETSVGADRTRLWVTVTKVNGQWLMTTAQQTFP